MAKSDQVSQKRGFGGKKAIRVPDRFYVTHSEVDDDGLNEMLDWFADLQPKLGVEGIARLSRRGEGTQGWWAHFSTRNRTKAQNKRRFWDANVRWEDHQSLKEIHALYMVEHEMQLELFEMCKDYLYHSGKAQSIFAKILERVARMSGNGGGWGGAVGV